MSKHILVLGATGVTGQIFVQEALKAGHQLSLYVRSPAKLPAAISQHANVTVIEGDLEDTSSLQKASQCGATIFVSFAGPSRATQGTPLTDAYKALFPLLIQDGHITRVLVLSTPSFPAPEDKSTFKWNALIYVVKLISAYGYAEMHGVGQVTSTQPVDKLKWTVFRVPSLTNGAAAPVKATFTGAGDDTLFLSRASMAAWVLQEIEEDKWIGRAPLLCN